LKACNHQTTLSNSALHETNLQDMENAETQDVSGCFKHVIFKLLTIKPHVRLLPSITWD